MLVLPLLTGCEAVKAIFKAGVWVGALGVIGVIALVVYFLGRGKG